jgi:hypothetical protein
MPWQSAGDRSFGPGAGMMTGPGAGMMGGLGSGRMWGNASAMGAVAAYLGLTNEALWERVQGGETLAEIATAQGKTAAGVEDAMLTAMSATLDTNASLTAQEKSDWLARARQNVRWMITSTHMAGTAHGGMMGRGGSGAAGFSGGMMSGSWT